ncbi:MAG: hypothetical protein ACPHCT_00970, partial [Flavobacteriales bacterium]
WEYITAYNQFGALNQGNDPFGNATFRAYRYAPDYAAFDGRDMTPGDPVENNPLPFDCDLFPAPVDTTTQGVMERSVRLRIGPNPVRSVLRLEADIAVLWTLRDLSGRVLLNSETPDQDHSIPTSGLACGILLLEVTDGAGRPVMHPKRILIEN